MHRAPAPPRSRADARHPRRQEQVDDEHRGRRRRSTTPTGSPISSTSRSRAAPSSSRRIRSRTPTARAIGRRGSTSCRPVLTYVIDILRWVPYIGVLAGGYRLAGGTLPDRSSSSAEPPSGGARLPALASVRGRRRRPPALPDHEDEPRTRRTRRCCCASNTCGATERPALGLAASCELAEPEAVVERAHGELRVLLRGRGS